MTSVFGNLWGVARRLQTPARPSGSKSQGALAHSSSGSNAKASRRPTSNEPQQPTVSKAIRFSRPMTVFRVLRNVAKRTVLSPLTKIDQVTDMMFGPPRKVTDSCEDYGDTSKATRHEVARQKKQEEAFRDPGKVSQRPSTKEEREFLQATVRQLMKEDGPWTFRKFWNLHKMICESAGLDSMRQKFLRRIGLAQEPEELRISSRIFAAMTPDELAATSPFVFSFKSRLLIAEAANVTPEAVLKLFVEFDRWRTDRTWYFRRIELGRPLPNSFAEREWMALWDRPAGYSRSERGMSLEAFLGKQLHEKKANAQPPWKRSRIPGQVRWPRRNALTVPRHEIKDAVLRSQSGSWTRRQPVISRSVRAK